MPHLILIALIIFGTLGGGAWVVHAIRAPALAEANALAAVAEHNAAEAARHAAAASAQAERTKTAQEALSASRTAHRAALAAIPEYTEEDPCGQCQLLWQQPSSPQAVQAPPAPSSE